MPHRIPTEQEWEAVKKACDDARAAVRDMWHGLSAQQQENIRAMEFDYDVTMSGIDQDVPKEKELTDEAIAALEEAKSDYEDVLKELNLCIAELKA